MRLKQVLVEGEVFPAVQNLTATSTIAIRPGLFHDLIEVSSASAIVLTGIPCIQTANISDRQRITLMNVGDHVITLPSAISSGIALSAPLNLNPRSKLELIYSAALQVWLATSLPSIVAVSSGAADGNRLVVTLPTGRLDNSLINWASPGAIGAVIPNSVRATTLSLTDTTNSTFWNNGSFVTPGGIGVAGRVWTGGGFRGVGGLWFYEPVSDVTGGITPYADTNRLRIRMWDDRIGTTRDVASFYVDGGVHIGDSPVVQPPGVLFVQSARQATSLQQGAIVAAGGIASSDRFASPRFDLWSNPHRLALTAALTSDRAQKLPDRNGMLLLHPFHQKLPYYLTHFQEEPLLGFSPGQSGTGASSSIQTGGGLRMTAGTVAASSRATLRTRTNQLRLGQSVGREVDLCECTIMLWGIAQTASDYAVFRFGFLNTDSAAPTAGVWFEFNAGVSPNWRVVAMRDGSNQTLRATSIAAGSAPHRLWIVIRPGGTQAEFYIDGVMVDVINNPAHIPNQNNLMIAASHIRSTGTGGVFVQLARVGGGLHQLVDL